MIYRVTCILKPWKFYRITTKTIARCYSPPSHRYIQSVVESEFYNRSFFRNRNPSLKMRLEKIWTNLYFIEYMFEWEMTPLILRNRIIFLRRHRQILRNRVQKTRTGMSNDNNSGYDDIYHILVRTHTIYIYVKFVIST